MSFTIHYIDGAVCYGISLFYNIIIIYIRKYLQ